MSISFTTFLVANVLKSFIHIIKGQSTKGGAIGGAYLQIFCREKETYGFKM